MSYQSHADMSLHLTDCGVCFVFKEGQSAPRLDEISMCMEFDYTELNAIAEKPIYYSVGLHS